jgi:hypothetical protein
MHSSLPKHVFLAVHSLGSFDEHALGLPLRGPITSRAIDRALIAEDWRRSVRAFAFLRHRAVPASATRRILRLGKHRESCLSHKRRVYVTSGGPKAGLGITNGLVSSQCTASCLIISHCLPRKGVIRDEVFGHNSCYSNPHLAHALR